jgi:hypothetical protein
MILKDTIFIYCKWVSTRRQWSEAKVLHGPLRVKERERDLSQENETVHSYRMPADFHSNYMV